MEDSTAKCINNCKNHVNKYLEQIEKIELVDIKKIAIFALIESFAQSAIKTGTNSEKFCSFVIDNTKNIMRYKILNEIDPVTLFYKHLKFYKSKDIDYILNSLVWGDGYISAQKINEMVETNNIIFKLSAEQCIGHKYIELLYKYRCKLSHELCAPSPMFFEKNEINDIIYFAVDNVDLLEGNLRFEELCYLSFPYEYLRNLFRSAIYQFLDECQIENINPYQGKKLYRHWYEKI